MTFPNAPQGLRNSHNLDEGEYSDLKANFDFQVKKRLDLQTLEWMYWVPLKAVVPAKDKIEVRADITSDAHFQSHFLTGNFTTLNVGGADDGTNHITARISDGDNDLKLMNSATPMDLCLSPGRVLAPAVAGNPSNSLFYPIPYRHTFAANGSILIEFSNDGDTDNIVKLLFMGKKLRAKL